MIVSNIEIKTLKKKKDIYVLKQLSQKLKSEIKILIGQMVILWYCPKCLILKTLTKNWEKLTLLALFGQNCQNLGLNKKKMRKPHLDICHKMIFM